MKEFRALFLNPDWEYDIVCSVLNAKMNSKNSFSAYTGHVITGNNLLRGTDSCLEDAGLKNTLMMNMTDSLASHVCCLPEAECICLSDLKFELWVPAIAQIDNTLSGQKRQMEEIAHNLLKKRLKTKKQPTMYDNNENQQRPYASGANATSRGYWNRHSDQNQHPQQSQNRGGFSDRNNKCEHRCPFLTDEERKVLAEHDGCFKCQMPYTKHFTADCPNGFPSPDNYKIRTHAWCLHHKPGTVASIHANYNSHSYSKQPTASTSRAHITPVPETPLHSSIAVLPLVNFMLEGEDSDFSASPSPKAGSDRDNVSLSLYLIWGGKRTISLLLLIFQ